MQKLKWIPLMACMQLKKVNLKTGAVTVLNSPTYDVPNGMVLDNQGKLIVCQQGDFTQGGFIQRIDLTTLNRTVVADNWFGVPFNSPNDAVVKRDGSIWFTDPSYGSVQGFRSAPKVNNQVYRISVSGVVDAMADGFTQTQRAGILLRREPSLRHRHRIRCWVLRPSNLFKLFHYDTV